MTERRKQDIDDPASFLFSQAEFHDCRLTVGDPSTYELEEVVVVRSQLVAHSSVLRNIVLDDLTGSSIHIKDVRPDIFKIMLKHIYGGSLPELKTLAKEKVLELVFSADKYKIHGLLEKANRPFRVM